MTDNTFTTAAQETPHAAALEMIRLQAAQEAAKEYRWEIKGIGQGHYHRTLGSAYDAAHQASLQGAGQTVTIEQFRPTRQHLITITNGKEA